MALLDLFALAEENDAALAAALDTLRGALSGNHGDRVESFCRTVTEEGRVSLNMKPWKMWHSAPRQVLRHLRDRGGARRGVGARQG